MSCLLAGKVLAPHVPVTRDDNLKSCVQRDFKSYLFFPFLYLFIFFGVNKGVPLLLSILKCNEEFKPI